MTGSPTFHTALTDHPPGHPRRHVARVAAVALAALIGLVALPGLTPPPPPTAAQIRTEFIAEHPQTMLVSPAAAVDVPLRDSYAATPGIATLAAGGTNYDWAKLVCLLAGFPMTDSNVLVITRWMRQENYVDSWWNRNNPLNNGWGSGGGGGTGSYDSLLSAAENAAAAFHGNPGYSGFVEAFMRSAPTEEIEAAIWASPWASGHYDNGAHWSYADVPVITAPADAW
jgi:hypothetical protein